MKKVLGYLFIVIAVILSLHTFIELGKIIKMILALFAPVSTPYDISFVAGYVAVRALLIWLIVVLFKYGRLWTRKQPMAKPLEKAEDQTATNQ